MTIRPEEYWSYILNNVKSHLNEKDIMQLLADHEQKGFAFYPHKREEMEGEVTYGETSMTLDFISNNFAGLHIAGVEINKVDNLQLIVFLTK